MDWAHKRIPMLSGVRIVGVKLDCRIVIGGYDMDKIEEFVDERLKSWCIHCGAGIGEVETSEDHVPSKGLLRKPRPANLPVVRICTECNTGFSADEEYLFLFLNCVLAGSTDPDRQGDPRAMRALMRHGKLRARIERSKKEYRTISGETRYIWTPETERIHRVIVKNARGHVFFEFGEPILTEPDQVSAAPLESLTVAQRNAFESIQGNNSVAGWPEVGSPMMARVVTGQDLSDGWVIVQDGTYRYGVVQCGVTLVRSVLYNYLATEVCWNEHP